VQQKKDLVFPHLLLLMCGNEPHKLIHLYVHELSQSSRARCYDAMEGGGFLSTITVCSMYHIAGQKFRRGITSAFMF
jgi:hypothetical protein